MLGIALGVAALIIVLSVMNGFQKEVRDRMLAVVSHIELTTPTGEGFADVDAVLKKVRQHPEVVAAAPFVAQQALLARGLSLAANGTFLFSSKVMISRFIVSRI